MGREGHLRWAVREALKQGHQELETTGEESPGQRERRVQRPKAGTRSESSGIEGRRGRSQEG